MRRLNGPAVTGTDCKKYIINNNNWGNESGTYQQLSYTGNSFTDTVTSGSGGGANVVSFPSIYIGGNGQIGGGTFNTCLTAACRSRSAP